MKDDRHYVTALVRGLEVLRCFTPDRMELGSTEIARLIGLSQSTTWRLCYTLQKAGYLVPGKDSDRLRVSPAVLSLGCASICQTGIADAAISKMDRIADRFHASVSIATRDGLKMVIVGRAVASTMLKLNFQVGSALNIERSALGIAYLAGTDEEERRELMDALRQVDADAWPECERRILREVRRFRERGYVMNLGGYHSDVNAIGVPIVSADSKRVMAVNCGGATSVMTREVLEGRVAEAMKELAGYLAPMVAF